MSTPRPSDEDVRAFLDRLIAGVEAHDALNATAFIVVTHDLATGHDSYNGPFSDPITAARYAIEMEEDVNKGFSSNDEPPWNQGWKCRVEILEEPSER